LESSESSLRYASGLGSRGSYLKERLEVLRALLQEGSRELENGALDRSDEAVSLNNGGGNDSLQVSEQVDG
jgi:hypothetical protein